MRIAIVGEAHSREAVEIYAGATAALDGVFCEGWRRKFGTLPRDLSEWGIWYEREHRCHPDNPDDDELTCSEERFATLPEMLRMRDRGQGADCDDIAPAHCALLRAHGIDPKARVKVIDVPSGNYHVVVLRGNGAIDDACGRLGMPMPTAANIRKAG